MLELIVIVLFCGLFLSVCKLMFKITWGITKVLALTISVLAIPALVGCLLFAGGVVLLLPVAMLVGAIILIKN